MDYSDLPDEYQADKSDDEVNQINKMFSDKLREMKSKLESEAPNQHAEERSTVDSLMVVSSSSPF